MQILISCSHQDVKLAGVLKTALSEHFPRPFLYVHDMHFGDDIKERLRREILRSDALLVVVTPYSIASEYVKWEIEFTLGVEQKLEKSIIKPILMSGNFLHPLLPQRHHADFRTDHLIKKNYKILVEQLLKMKPYYGAYRPLDQRINMKKLLEDVFQDPHTHTIVAPMIGDFYRTSGPDKPPFVNIGDFIKPGQVLCIIEAMKLFNEIESEVAGKIIKILADDGAPVEYDQPLFTIEIKPQYKSLEEYLLK